MASLRAAVEDADLTTVAGVTGLLAFLMPGTFAPDWLASLARWATRNLEGLMPWSAGAEVCPAGRGGPHLRHHFR